jgi:hypothetical protein
MDPLVAAGPLVRSASRVTSAADDPSLQQRKAVRHTKLAAVFAVVIQT